VLCGFSRKADGAKRQTMTSVGEVTAEEGIKKFLCTQPGIEPATSMRRGWYHKTINCQCTAITIYTDTRAKILSVLELAGQVLGFSSFL
jgi:hypothetical protein